MLLFYYIEPHAKLTWHHGTQFEVLEHSLCPLPLFHQPVFICSTDYKQIYQLTYVQCYPIQLKPGIKRI